MNSDLKECAELAGQPVELPVEETVEVEEKKPAKKKK